MNPRKPEMNVNSNRQRQLFLSGLLLNNSLLDQYKQLKNDEERFKLVLDIIVQHSATLFDPECQHKAPEHSVRMREQGNESFMEGLYYDAVQDYTGSIVYAVDSSEELALGYANRSAALFKVEKYEECIADIDRALNSKYPDRLKSKLYKRKGFCLMILGQPGADSTFQEALVWLDKMTLSKDKMDESERELTKLISDPQTDLKPPKKLIQHPLPEIHTPNSELLCATDAVALQYSTERGRHLVATRKIRPGEILVLEKPYCLKLLPKHVYTHCEYCLQVSWNMIPCKYCIHAAFCSDACKDKAWDEYHEMECPVVGMLRCFEVSDALWVSMRMTIMATKKGMELNALRQELVNMDYNIDPRTKGFSDDRKLHSDQYRSICSLPNNADTCTAQQLLAGGFWAALTICALARESTIFGEKLALDTLAKNPDVIFVGKLMLKHVHIGWIKTHSYGASRRSSAYEHGQALMALCGLTNHSCDPNTIRQWYADRLALYAAYPIEKGEEVLDNYGLHYTTMTKSERQQYLERRNIIDCKCIPCIENWPPLSDILSYKRQVQLGQECRNKLNEALKEFSVTFQGFIDKGVLENVPNILREVTKLIEIFYEIVKRPCKELAMAVVMLTDLYASVDTVFDYSPVGFSGIEMQCLIFQLYLKDTLAKMI